MERLFLVHYKIPKQSTNLSSGVRARYSLSIRPSIRFLMITGDGRKRLFSCSVTSATNTLC